MSLAPDRHGQEGICVPEAWDSAAQRILAGGIRRVLILGARDVGKSTFCRFLGATAAAEGCTVTLLDADIGQKMLGPPACVTRGLMAGNGTILLDALGFVGGTDPARAWTRLLASSRRLAAEATTKLMVVNTGGLFTGARQPLMDMFAALSPDLVVALGAFAPEPCPTDEGNPPILVLAPSSAARRKTDSERREARRKAFELYFARAEAWQASGAMVAAGAPVPGAVPPPGLVMGLTDAQGRDQALGLAAPIRNLSGALNVLTPGPSSGVVCLRWGEIRLDQTFRDHWIPRADARKSPPQG